MLEIGCGVGGFAAIAGRTLQSRAAEYEIHLLDFDQIEPVFYGYAPKTARYNSSKLTLELIEANGVPADRVTFHDAAQGFPVLRSIDLVVSLLSWGFHYPVNEYLESVCLSLAPSGAVLLDVRRGTRGEEDIRATFSTVEVVRKESKFLRLAASGLARDS